MKRSVSSYSGLAVGGAIGGYVGPAFSRRRHGGGDGGHDDFSALDPYLPFIMYGVAAILALWVAWTIYRWLTRSSSQSKARVEAARRRSERRLNRRS